MHRKQRPPGRREQGFTLVELMVAVMVVAVLLAVAIPVFTGFRARAQDSAAKNTLDNAAKVAIVVMLDGEGFPAAAELAAVMAAQEPRIAWLDSSASSTGPRLVSIGEDGGGSGVVMAARSESGRCYYLRIRWPGAISRHLVEAAGCRAQDYVEGAGAAW